MNLPNDFQESKLYWFITSIQKYSNDDDNLKKSVEYLNEVYGTSHRGVTKTELKTEFMFEFGGLRFSPGLKISNAFVFEGDGSGVLKECIPLGNDQFRLEYTSTGGVQPYLSFGVAISYKNKDIPSILRDGQSLAQDALQYMKESL